MNEAEVMECELLQSEKRVRKLEAEAERLRHLLRRIVDCPKRPWPFRGGEPDVGQFDEWFELMKQATEAGRGNDED